jgi:hypothetical protein
MASISWSANAGISGATITAVGMPAAASSRIAESRRWGDGARGSSARASAGSRVVIDTATWTRPSRAIPASRSRSRRISADLVTMVSGWRVSASTSRMPRVTRNRRSTGCQASVLMPSATGRQT